MGDDIVLGGGLNRSQEDLIEQLGNEPFELTDSQKAKFKMSDGQIDTFIFGNDGNGYTATIVGFEAGIDQLDLSQYSLGSAEQPEVFQEAKQLDGNSWEYKTNKVNGAEVVLRIDAAPDVVNAALM